ncbi:MAG: cytochrome c oxidase subunit II [Acidobacteriota bacterium]|nr:cytochrome c oxidase subunit II [Acidobacteriota bacterium]
MRDFLGQPANYSAHGGQIDQLMYIIHGFMLVLFIGWGIFFLYTLWRFRSSKSLTADYKGVTGKSSKYLEIAVALFEGVLLIAFSVPLYADRVDDFPPESEATVMRLIAEQFKWHFHYPGPDGVFGKTSVDLVDSQDNPLGLDRESEGAADDVYAQVGRAPVDKPVIIHLSSRDVIHCLNLPNMRVKQDAIPGMSIPVWFTPVGAGEFEIACAQLCGIGHATMFGKFNVLDQAGYDKWMADEQTALEEEGEYEEF